MEHFPDLLDSFSLLYAVNFRKEPVERGGSSTKIMERQLDKCWVLIHSVLQLFCFNGTPLETLALASSKDVNLPRNTKCFRFKFKFLINGCAKLYKSQIPGIPLQRFAFLHQPEVKGSDSEGAPSLIPFSKLLPHN